jgi:aspartyl-tRNA(Asn)/glutamyl-tRNA(Gln) amidotransferase subunit A
MTELYSKTIYELHALLAAGEVTSREITEAVLARIDAVDEKVHAYITVTSELARKGAQRADERIRSGAAGLLTGIPLAIKDNLCIKGVATTCGSKSLAQFVPPYSATVIKALAEQGAVFVGRTNMDEFAMGSSTENSCFGPTRNPWNPALIPGGSSGGSAAAVAADECIAALGTDTGGSIRQPAAFCGLVGLKPTYGRVSRFGLIAFASSLDQVGPMAKDVRDAAMLLNGISGYDRLDSTSANAAVPDYTAVLGKEVDGMRVGIPGEYFTAGLDAGIERAVRESIKVLEGLKMEIREISLPHTEYAVAAYYLVAPAEASSNLARYDGVKYGFRGGEEGGLLDMYTRSRSEGFGVEVKRRIMLGTYALSAGYYDAYYKKASQVRTLIRDDFSRAFRECDVIITPTCPNPPFALGEKLHDPLSVYLADIFTVPASLAGIPGISVPCGFTEDGLPIGVQLLANFFREETLLQVAHAYEQNTTWHNRKPPLAPQKDLTSFK